MTKVIVPLADGVEEMEAVTIIDVLRRAEWDVVAAGVTGEVITTAHNMKLLADQLIADLEPETFDLIVIPGGFGGVENLLKCDMLLQWIRTHHAAGKIVAAICAGPCVLHAAGVLDDCRMTSYPGTEEHMPGVNRQADSRVVMDGNVITSQGPGTTIPFALTIIEEVDGAKAAHSIAAGLIAD